MFHGQQPLLGPGERREGNALFIRSRKARNQTTGARPGVEGRAQEIARPLALARRSAREAHSQPISGRSQLSHKATRGASV